MTSLKASAREAQASSSQPGTTRAIAESYASLLRAQGFDAAVSGDRVSVTISLSPQRGRFDITIEADDAP